MGKKMPRNRSLIAGMTDYTGVDLEDIERHLRDWRDNTADAIGSLAECLKEVEEKRALLEAPNAVNTYINYFIDLFTRYLADFDRLLHEFPSGVRNTHVEILSQIFQSSKFEDNRCVQFKNQYIEKGLEHEEIRPLLDRICRETRGQIIDYLDLSNLVIRLRTFALANGPQPADSSLADAFELKPNFFGIGLNLKFIWGKLKKWWPSRPKQ